MDTKEGTSATRAKNKYNAKAYDRIHVSLKKGQKKDVEDAAAAHGLSLNAFVMQAIENVISGMNPDGCINNLVDVRQVYIDQKGMARQIMQCSICKKFYYQDFLDFRLYEMQKDSAGTWYRTMGYIQLALIINK